jgi:cell division cycle 14
MDDTCSVDTVCKDYQQFGCPSPSKRTEPLSFVSFLSECGVNMVIRANFSQEQGMVKPSYDANMLRRVGINHCEVPYVDKEGALPRNKDVAKVIRMCQEDAGRDGAVLIHCKGGFGRSMILACMVVMCRYDVPGRALLGWVRMARPGSINTPEQEQFLCLFEGRDDVLRFAGLPSDFQTLDAAESGQPCCSLQ